MKLKVLAIHGKMHSGKSSLSRGIRNSHLRWWHAEFKRPIVRAMHDLGFHDLDNKTPEVRRLMQALGPALLQKEPTLILDSMYEQLEAAYQGVANGVVIDDLRRLEELTFLADLAEHEPDKYDIQTLKLVREDYAPPTTMNPGDLTETALDGWTDWDMVLKLKAKGDDPNVWLDLGRAVVLDLFALPS